MGVLSIFSMKKSPERVGGFFLDLQLRHQVVVALGVFALEVLHEAAAFTNLFDETTAGGEVLLVRAEVIRQILDLFREDGDLDLRGTRVGRMGFKLLNDALLFVDIEHVGVGIERPQWIRLNRILGVRARVRVTSSRNHVERDAPEGRRCLILR